MVSEKTLKEYGYSELSEYFEYIELSRINGQISQVKTLIASLSKSQYALFIYWLMENAPKLKEFIK